MAMPSFVLVLFVSLSSLLAARRIDRGSADLEVEGSTSVSWRRCKVDAQECEAPHFGIACPVPETDEAFRLKADSIVGQVVKNMSNILVTEYEQVDTALTKIVRSTEHASFTVAASLEKMDGLKWISTEGHKLLSWFSSGKDLRIWDEIIENIMQWATSVADLRKDLELICEQGEAMLSDGVNKLLAAKIELRRMLKETVNDWANEGFFSFSADHWEAYTREVAEWPYLKLKPAVESAILKLEADVTKIKDVLVQVPRSQPWRLASHVKEDLLPMFEGKKGWISSAKGVVETLTEINNNFKQVYMESVTRMDLELARALGKNFRARDVIGYSANSLQLVAKTYFGPFRLVELTSDIFETFLKRDLPRSFLGSSTCLNCTTKRSGLLVEHSTEMTPQGLPAICLRATSFDCLRSKAVCACYGHGDLMTAWNREAGEAGVRLLTRAKAPERFSTAGAGSETGCTHTLFHDDSERPAANLGTSGAVPPERCPARVEEPEGEFGETFNLRICMATWNVGSAKIVKGVQVGTGGVDDKRGELIRDLRRVLHEGCNLGKDKDIVVLTIQEGSESQILQDLHNIAFDFGPSWHVVGHAFAEKPGGLEVGPYVHLDNLLDNPSESFTKGVHVAILSRLPKGSMTTKSYGVDLITDISRLLRPLPGRVQSSMSWMLDSSAKMGAAVLDLSLNLPGPDGKRVKRSLCFVGAHLSGQNEEARTWQAKRVESSLDIIGCNDGAWWGGGFNPRLDTNQCCPWDQLRLLMHHGQVGAVSKLIRDADPIIKGNSWRKQVDPTVPFVLDQWNCSGPSCGSGMHELPLRFAPTFKKLWRREQKGDKISQVIGDLREQLPKSLLSVHDQGQCGREQSATNLSVHIDLNDEWGPVEGERLGEALQIANADNKDIIEAWELDKTKSEGVPLKCPQSSTPELCWDGDYSPDGCALHGRCYDATNSQCPVYTDRILFRSGTAARAKEGMSIQGCTYEAFHTVTTADHAPVVASFSVDIAW